MIQAGTVIFATDASAEGIEAAKAWARAQGFTADDVRIVKRDGQCLVIATRAVKPAPTL